MRRKLEWSKSFHVAVEASFLFLLWTTQMAMIKTIKTEKDKGEAMRGVGGKGKSVQCCPHTHNKTFLKQFTLYNIRTHILSLTCS